MSQRGNPALVESEPARPAEEASHPMSQLARRVSSSFFIPTPGGGGNLVEATVESWEVVL